MTMKRRTFLKLSAMGAATGGISAAFGCGSDIDKTLFPMVKASDDMVPGKSIWYAATCRECPGGCGILVKSREERAVKIEGNPLHPVNKGKLCMRGQAALQGVYHPDRLKTPLVKKEGRFRQAGFDEALAILREKTVRAAEKGPDRVRMLTELTGETLLEVFQAAARQWDSRPPLVYEPFACESLKAAGRTLFGYDLPPDYRLQDADLLISFGADFLETWLSPVSYTRRFKEMHGFSGQGRGGFIHVSPYQSLTAANADRWICCAPGSEQVAALGLIRGLLEKGRGETLAAELRAWLTDIVSPFTQDRVSKKTGISRDDWDALLSALAASGRPLVLGAGAISSGGNASALELAALLLNLVLDPSLSLLDFENGHRMGLAASRADILDFFDQLKAAPATVLLLNQVNPLYTMPTAETVRAALESDDHFVVCFSNMLDDTARLADLVIPIQHSLESWDEYGARKGVVSLLQPGMAPLTDVPHVGDLILKTAFGETTPGDDYKARLARRFYQRGLIRNEREWLEMVRRGGLFHGPDSFSKENISAAPKLISEASRGVAAKLLSLDLNLKNAAGDAGGLLFMAAPSIRFFDGRGGDKPWLCEVPDPVTSVAWQTPVLMHPETLQGLGIAHEEKALITSHWGEIEATVYETEGVHPQTVVMPLGQGHAGFGRYADGKGANPLMLLPGDAFRDAGMPTFATTRVTVTNTGRKEPLAHTDGSRIQHGRKIALSVSASALDGEKQLPKDGLSMNDFPLTLPLPEGYDAGRDIYPPHAHDGYRWAMTVDLDRCVGCGACAVACYAENNVAIVGEKHIIEGREMAWLRVERYHDMADAKKITFLPMMCQHCDNAPCEAVCPVYVPHHSKEGLNNQIYNRCIGTRFCSQNCPYKVRRFNWFDWQWPNPLQQQLNPNVTVRSKGVMEKCSFCIQRIKEAHGQAKNENRDIQDGEVLPACVQTCPTDALVFGNLMDTNSRVRKLSEDPRAYQVMGYLNTKPAVIYLKKVLRDV